MPCGTLVSAACSSLSPTGLLPSLAELSISLLLASHNDVRRPTTPEGMPSGLASSPFARRYSGNHYLFSLPTGTKMFQFPAFASPTWLEITGLQPAGLSHSEIRGSKDICSYPRLIAAYHVLHRLREPRHPPDALTFFRRFPYYINTYITWNAHTISCN